MGSAFTYTGFTCFAVTIVSACVEGMVVLKGDADSGIVLALYYKLLFLYVTQYLEYIRCTIPHFVSTHFTEMRHILSFHHDVLGAIWNKYTHPEGCTITEDLGSHWHLQL